MKIINNKNIEKGMSTKLKFTVITVGLNVEKTIEKTIISVLNQTVAPYEYFIVDGLSTDKTVEIAESYSDLFAQKGIKYTIISEEDSGVCDAMNKGIRLATGDFISFLNAGDWYELDALEKIQSFYDEEPFDLTYGGLHYIMQNGKIVDKMSRLDHFPVSTRNWNHPSMFLRRDIHQKNELNGADYSVCADVDLYLKLRKNGTKIRVIDEVITNYVAGGWSNDPNIKSALRRASEKYRAYRSNGYSRIYWLEVYGWEALKVTYMRLHKKK